MTELRLSRQIAQIIVYGHVSLFIYGLVLIPLLTHLPLTDVAHMVLMGSPILALVATSAFKWVIANPQVDDESEAIDSVKVTMMRFVTLAFILSLFFIYSLALFRVPGMGPDTLKTTVGVVETVLGVYLGIIKDALFPSI